MRHPRHPARFTRQFDLDECPTCGSSVARKHHHLREFAAALHVTEGEVAELLRLGNLRICATFGEPMISCASVVELFRNVLAEQDGRDVKVLSVEVFESAPCEQHSPGDRGVA